MNRLLKGIITVSASALALSLSGCATAPGQEIVRKEVDRDYIAAVERSARRMPVRVLWVNPPLRDAATVEDPPIPDRDD